MRAPHPVCQQPGGQAHGRGLAGAVRPDQPGDPDPGRMENSAPRRACTTLPPEVNAFAHVLIQTRTGCSSDPLSGAGSSMGFQME